MALQVIATAALAFTEPPMLARTTPAAVVSSPRLSAPAEMTMLDRRAVLSATAAAVLTGLPAASLAEATLVTRQASYTRYVPRIERGRDYWATKLRKDIANGEWKAIAKELEPVGKKDAGGAIMKTLGPMSLWSSSFSSKVISDKTIAMNAAIEELEVAVQSLQIAAAGEEKASGMFSFLGGGKKLDESSRKALAAAAYKKGVNAFNKYIEIGNDNLGLNFAPLDTID